MRNWLLLVLGLCAVMAAMSIQQGPKPAVVAPTSRYGAPTISTTTVKNTQDMTVLISNESMEGVSRGTGILLDPTTVLTCEHMLPKGQGTRNMWIYPYPGAQVVHAKLKFVNKPNDLALLELTTPVLGHKTAVFAQKVEIGEPIVVVGNISGYMMWFVSYGMISGEHDRWVLTDATIRGGNSGGPWVNARGEIVALTDVGWNDADGHNVGISGGVPVKALQKFLAESRASKIDPVYAVTGE